MRNSNLRRNLCAVVALMPLALPVWAFGAAASPGARPWARVVYVECERIDPSVFASEAPIHEEEKLDNIVLFDPKALPSYYKTCYGEPRAHRHLKIVRPYNKASFPRNIAPPNFRWEDQINNRWKLSLKAPGWPQPLRVITSATEWRPDRASWEAVKSADTGKWVELQVRGCVVKNGRRSRADVSVDSIVFRVSPHNADPFIVYRLVSPLFHGLKTPSIYYRDISNVDTRMFYPAKDRYCTNCHSFPGDPSLQAKDLKLAIAVRGMTSPRTYDRILGLYDFNTQQGRTLNINSFFMSWDPNGTNVAVTGGQSVKVRPLITLETQEFYVVTADINIVDAETLKATRLAGASEPQYMESFPTWSPDGKTIVFARTQEMPAGMWVERRFSLYKVPYNNGKGGKAAPIPGASHNGKSNFAARFSPNGKWIVFNQADWSSLVAPTADLWIVGTEDGARPRPLQCNYPYAMDSHHSWSSNSRWLLFATKRDDGIFARIYLTEINDEGDASPPVELPTLEKEMMCYNVPEFLKCRVRVDAEDIVDKIGSLKR